MWEFIKLHEVIFSLLSFWVFSNAIGAMPTPATTSSGFYQWFYKFSNGLLQVIAANATRVPEIRNFLGIAGDSTVETKK